MGATDNAFIRAYQGRPDPSSVRRRSRASGVREDERGITISANAEHVSQLLTAPNADRTELHTAHSHFAEPHLPGTTQTTVSCETSPRQAAKDDLTRFDAPQSRPPVPHIRPKTVEPMMGPPQPTPASPIEPPSPPMEPVTTTHLSSSPRREQEREATRMDQSPYFPLGKSAVPEWQPQWEVDRFRWPEVCDELEKKSAGKLSELARPILNTAWRGRNVIAVTSFDRGEGGSTIALCLARMAASFGVLVAMVEGDLQKPSLGRSLGLSFDSGWNAVQQDDETGSALRAVSIGSLHESLVVVPTDRKSTEMALPTAARVLQELSANFELVILDLGPIFTAAHCWLKAQVAAHIHGTIVVRDLRTTTGDHLADVCARLRTARIEQIAIVENFQ